MTLEQFCKEVMEMWGEGFNKDESIEEAIKNRGRLILLNGHCIAERKEFYKKFQDAFDEFINETQ